VFIIMVFFAKIQYVYNIHNIFCCILNKVHPLADKKFKSLLNMCAICAVRHDKELKMYYERKVSEGKAKMLVINNVRAKLLARVFAVINRDSPFINTCKFAS
jgi:hypothetical protein